MKINLADDAYLRSLEELLLNSVAKAIDGKRVCYIEYPLYLNVGDLAIMQGTVSLFKKIGADVVLVKTKQDFDVKELKRVIRADDAIVLQGGGNFGDLYAEPQFIRREIARNFPNHRIIILPQTIFYESDVENASDAQLFSACTNLKIFARDDRSAERALAFTADVECLPDMAHALYTDSWFVEMRSRDSVANGSPRILNFLRRDKEAAADVDLSTKDNSMDWDDVVSKQDIYVTIFLMKIMKFRLIKRGTKLSRFFFEFWKIYSRWILRRCCRFFASYDVVVTSRLHGHILCVLVGAETKVINNSYGKNREYLKRWTSKLSFVSEI